MAPKELIDDSEHDVMYISPGDCPGGNGRTYGWKHAKDADEKADLVDQGYSPTLEEAYATAGKPLKDRERSKPAGWKPGDDKPKKAAPVKAPKADPVSGATLEAVQAALAKLKEAKDAKTVTALLKGFEATSATKLDEGQYEAVIAAAEAAAKE